MRLERDEGVVVLTMEREENRFNPEHLDELEAALDEVASMDGHPAMVLAGEGKFFSLGLDLEWMGAAEPTDAKAMVERTMAAARPAPDISRSASSPRSTAMRSVPG